MVNSEFIDAIVALFNSEAAMQCFLCNFQFRPTFKLIMCKHCIVWSIAWAAGPNRIEETVCNAGMVSMHSDFYAG